MACEATAYARAGLIGNPSDGYFGKTISFIIRDFSAKVTLYENAQLEIVPSMEDKSQYAGMRELVEDVHTNGYYGGIRLMKAAVKKFHDYCVSHEVELPNVNFSVRYRSTIPRRLGLAGSSALVTATIKCLMDFFDVDIPKALLPNLILSVETEELGIAAGLQDRVIQVYEGVVFMDFDRDLMERQYHGIYEELDPASLPPLFIAYRLDLGEGSETIHNNVRQRWIDGDPKVIDAMHDFASYAQETRELLVAGRGMEIGPLMDKNFERRKTIFRLDPRNVEMVEVARSVGAHAKYAGSGGAIVGMYYDEDMRMRLADAMARIGASIITPRIESV
jgi:glucuronokinase